MGKNQAHKQMQRAKMSTHAATGPGEEGTESNDGFVSPAWPLKSYGAVVHIQDDLAIAYASTIYA